MYETLEEAGGEDYETESAIELWEGFQVGDHKMLEAYQAQVEVSTQ